MLCDIPTNGACVGRVLFYTSGINMQEIKMSEKFKQESQEYLTSIGIGLFFGLLAYVFGHMNGSNHGAKQYHEGKMACQTFPNNETVCWNVKK